MTLHLKKTILISLAILICIFILTLVLYPITPAFAADGGYMTDINFREFVSSPDESGQGTILSGGTAVLQSIVTYIFLPIAIVFVVWKIVVIGVCTMIGIDWTKFINITDIHAKGEASDTAVGSTMPRQRKRDQMAHNMAPPSGHSPADSATAVKQIARDTIKGLIIVFCVWGIIELIMAAVYIFIEMGKSFAV